MTQSDADSPENQSAKRAVLVLAAIVVLLAVLNSVVKWLFLGPGRGNDWLEVLIIGGLVFELILFGVWAALGAGSLLTRLPLAIPCLLMLIVAPGLDTESYSNIERRQFITIACAGLAIFTVAMLTALAVRRFTSLRIDHLRITQNGQSRVRFSMKYLLTTITVWSLLLGMAAQLTFRTKPPPFSLFGPDFGLYVSLFIGALASIVLVPITAVALLMLRPRFSTRAVRIASAFWLVVTALTVGIFAYLNKPQMNSFLDMLWEHLVAVLLIQLGATIVGLLVVLPMRLAGFRLLSVHSGDMQTLAGNTTVTQ